jgi:predicted outer membrane repeat protein
MKKQILFTFTILILAVCLIGAVSAETADENGLTLSGDAVNNTSTIVETEEPIPDVIISGDVQKCSDGNPFPGVTVTVTSSEETISTTTNADGTYSLNFKSGSTNFKVAASAPGHQTSTQEVTVLPGEDNVYLGTANFKLGMDTVYVATTGSDVTGDGTQANPYQTIGKGITEVNVDGTVNVADGTYYEHLTINKNVNLVGTSQTGAIIDGSNTGKPITINGATVSISLFTIQNGVSGFSGGAIDNYGTVTVNSNTFINNSATYGGAIFNAAGSTLNVIESTFTDNIGIFGGGAIYDAEGTSTVTGSTFTNNLAAYGGAIYTYGTVTVSDSTFNGNRATSYGGAIWNYYGYDYDATLTVTDSAFTGNTAPFGGAIYNYATLWVSDSTFNGNSATNSGGAIYNNDNYCSANVKSSTFTANTATDGGAIYNAEGNVNAEYNWWGSNNPDFATLISGVVDYNLRLYMTFQADPTTIQQGSTSTLTANFNNAFDGETVIPLNPADGHLPDGILVTFTTDLGHVGSQTVDKPTVDGVAFATLTGTESGVANVSAMLDDETLTSTVDIQSHSQSELYIETSSSNNNPIVGDVITVTFKLGNRGPDTAENVVMAYVIPEGLEFVTANDDTGNTWTYDENTRTLTWNVGSVPKGDPNLWLTLRVVRAGQYLINPALTTSTYDPTLNSNIQSITINAAAGSDPDNKNNTTVNAATITETVGMQETGTPLTGIVLAILMVLGGLIATRKN